MTEAWAYAGGALLAAATLPQAWRLIRTRSAHDFSWTFSAFNFVGLALLAARGYEIREWGFFAINVLTTAFWGLVLVVKATSPGGRRVLVPSSPVAVEEPLSPRR